MAAKGRRRDRLGKGLRLTVAGPMKAELAALQKEHDAYLKARSRTAVGGCARGVHRHLGAELSSIVVLAEVGESECC